MNAGINSRLKKGLFSEKASCKRQQPEAENAFLRNNYGVKIIFKYGISSILQYG